jgi:hypothetical protein
MDASGGCRIHSQVNGSTVSRQGDLVMSSQGTGLRLNALVRVIVIATGVSTTPALAGHHPDVRIRIIQRSGVPAAVTVVPGTIAQVPAAGSASPVVVGAAPVSYGAAQVLYSAAPVTYNAAPVTYTAAPVAYNAAPVSYSAAPVTYTVAPAATASAPASAAAAPSAGGQFILVAAPASSGSSTASAAPSSDDMVEVQLGSAKARVPRSVLSPTNNNSARAPGVVANTAAAPAAGQQFYLVAAPATNVAAAPITQAAPTQVLQLQAAPQVLQLQAATTQLQTQPAQGTAIIVKKRWCR